MRLFYALIFLYFCSSNAQDVSTYKIFTKDTAYLNIINLTYAPIEISVVPNVEFKDSIEVNRSFLLEPVDSAFIAAVPRKYINDTSQIKWKRFITLDGVLGDSKNTKHDSTYLYTLPFSKKKKYKVIQGFNGKFTHYSVRSRYAIDFDLKVGDTVFAAREGIVVRIRDQYKEHGGKEFISKANLITVLHDDGTLAAYVHLDYKGVLVKPGDSIKRGQAIGISGFTGYTTTPHLHFVVREANNRSVPIFFEGYENKILKSGKKYVRKK